MKTHNFEEALLEIEKDGAHVTVHPAGKDGFEATIILKDETVLFADAPTANEALKDVTRLWREVKTQ